MYCFHLAKAKLEQVKYVSEIIARTLELCWCLILAFVHFKYSKNFHVETCADVEVSLN